MKDCNSQKKAESAKEIADMLLKMLNEAEVDPNIAQAALGDAWIRLIYVLGWKSEDAVEICKVAFDILDE